MISMDDSSLRNGDNASFYPLSTRESHFVVELSGLTKTARQVLFNQPLILLYFPFRMGRLSRSDPKSTAQQDLLLPDFRPFYVSRNHIVFDRRGDDIVIIDETSTCGTIIDDRLIGKRANGQDNAILVPGLHTIAIGGPGSPFLFQALVRQQKPSDFLALDHSIPDHLPQARQLYQKLCAYEVRLLEGSLNGGRDHLHAAREMARVMVNRPDFLEPLRCLASNPVCGSEYVAQHSVNVAIFSMVLHTTLKTPQEEIVQIVSATLLHDIGMQEIDKGILSKKGSLSKAEFDEIKRHTTIGRELVSGPESVHEIAVAFAGAHHERIDQSGYPGGTGMLSDRVRLLGFLDAFEALTHDRPHRQAFSLHQAVLMLTKREDSSFDIDTRKVFLNAFSFFPVSSIVKLSTGEIGQVVGINQGKPFAPQVRIIQGQGGAEGADGRLVDLGKDHLISIVKEIPERELFQRCAMS
jgi:HD-GYP domain-containing protein (c-di-GMP phosphodiesterase class II)